MVKVTVVLPLMLEVTDTKQNYCTNHAAGHAVNNQFDFCKQVGVFL